MSNQNKKNFVATPTVVNKAELDKAIAAEIEALEAYNETVASVAKAAFEIPPPPFERIQALNELADRTCKAWEEAQDKVNNLEKAQTYTLNEVEIEYGRPPNEELIVWSESVRQYHKCRMLHSRQIQGMRRQVVRSFAKWKAAQSKADGEIK